MKFKEINELIMDYQLNNEEGFLDWISEEVVPKLYSFIPINKITSYDELLIIEQLLINALKSEIDAGSYVKLIELKEKYFEEE